MIRCSYCQSENDVNAKFCANCGGSLVEKPIKEEHAVEESSIPKPEVVSSTEDGWQTVGQTSLPPRLETPPPPPPPGFPPQNAQGYQQVPQGQTYASFSPPPPAYTPAPQSPKKSNKGLIIGLLVGGLVLLGICIFAIVMITNSVKKRVDEGMQLATRIIEEFEGGIVEPLETAQPPLPTEPVETGEGEVITEPIVAPGYTLLLEDNFGPESIFESFEVPQTDGVLGENRFEISMKEEDYFGWKVSEFVNVQNVVLQVDAEEIVMDEYDSYGLLCRYVDAKNHIQAEVSPDEWIMIRKVVNGEEILLSSRRFKDISEPNSTITLACVDDLVIFFVNGNQVTTVKDPSPVSGDIGMMVGRFSEVPTKVAFRNFQAFEVEAGKPIVKSSDLPFSQTNTSLLPYENENYVYQNDLTDEAGAQRMRFFEDEHNKVGWANNALSVTIKNPSRSLNSVSTELNFLDMVVSVTVSEFEHDALIGVVCRHQSVNDFYAFGVAQDGWTTIYKYVNETFDELFGEYIDGVLPVGENVITGSCVKDTLTLLVNGEVIASVQDGDLISGDGGILTQSYKEYPITVEYKFLTISPVR